MWHDEAEPPPPHTHTHIHTSLGQYSVARDTTLHQKHRSLFTLHMAWEGNRMGPTATILSLPDCWHACLVLLVVPLVSRLLYIRNDIVGQYALAADTKLRHRHSVRTELHVAKKPSCVSWHWCAYMYYIRLS